MSLNRGFIEISRKTSYTFVSDSLDQHSDEMYSLTTYFCKSFAARNEAFSFYEPWKKVHLILFRFPACRV